MKKLKDFTGDLHDGGNAYSLLVKFKRQAKREGWANDEIEVVRTKALSGSYEELIATLKSHIEG